MSCLVGMPRRGKDTSKTCSGWLAPRQSLHAGAPGGHWRGAVALAGLGAVVFSLVMPFQAASAAEQERALLLRADLLCPTRTGEGRIVCELRIGAPEGQVLRWADGLVVEAPEFARPLRSRVLARLPEEGSSEAVVRLPLLAASENTGEVRVRARAVVCDKREPGDCRAGAREVSAPIAVTRSGQSSSP